MLQMQIGKCWMFSGWDRRFFSEDRAIDAMATVQAVLGGLTVAERGILTAVNTGASSLSFVGSGFIVLCYLLFKELRKFSFKLVFFLALSVSIPAHFVFVIYDCLFFFPKN